MLIQSYLTKSRCTVQIHYISIMEYTVLMEEKLHELGGTYGWDPLWRGALVIYGEEGNHCYSCLNYCLLWSVETFLPLAIQQGCSATQHKGVPGQESLPHPQGRRGSRAIFPHFGIWPKLPPLATTLFLQQDNFVLQGAIKEDLLSHSLNFFPVEGLDLYWRIREEVSQAYFHIIGIRPTILLPSQHSLQLDLRYFCRQLLGGSFELIGRSCL